MPDPDLAERTARVLGEIGDAARAAGRDPAELTTIVVTKYHPAALVLDLHALGIRHVGENRHQEAHAKAADVRAAGADGLTWHFIGQLQSNKARQVLEYAGAIHSIDRPSLLGPLTGSGVDAFIQVNLTDDPGRGGVAPAGLAELAERVLGTEGIRLRGLMAVAGLAAEARAEFARVRELRDRVLLPLAPAATALSMGMSGDFGAAIAEGATHLRIGTAITGNRPDPAYRRD